MDEIRHAARDRAFALARTRQDPAGQKAAGSQREESAAEARHSARPREHEEHARRRGDEIPGLIERPAPLAILPRYVAYRRIQTLGLPPRRSTSPIARDRQFVQFLIFAHPVGIFLMIFANNSCGRSRVESGPAMPKPPD